MNAHIGERDLIVGTHNRQKGAELAELLAPWGFRVVTLADVSEAIEVVEDGATFSENAKLKATQQARHLGQWVLADDSGLEVDALGGAPGVYSARFAAMNEERESSVVSRQSSVVSVDEANNRELLWQLGELPLAKRTAQYVCQVALADPTGASRAESHGVCRGRIRFEPAGSNGFGYDPLFEVVEYHRTFGELGPSVKRAISHRSRALRAMLPALRRLWSTEQGARS